MFKRVERKRKRREEEEESGFDEDTKQIMGLDDTDSDESDSLSKQDSARSSDSDSGVGDEENAAFEDEDIDKDPISVEEAIKDPIYLISLDPTVHGCVLCKGKLLKNARMAVVHKNASVHKRRFERFRQLSADADPHSNARELVKAVESAFSARNVDSQRPSKRALKRQAKQVAIREKRRRHQELKAKAMVKKSKKSSTAEGATPSAPSTLYLLEPQDQPGKTRKKRKSDITSSMSKTRGAAVKSAPRTKTSSDSRKAALKSEITSTRRTNKLS